MSRLLLTAPINTFAGNPLDRAGERRGDEGWLDSQAQDPRARVVVFLDGKPLLKVSETAAETAYVGAADVSALMASGQDRLFLGLDGETPVFCVQLSGETDPSITFLSGLGAFEDLRRASLRLDPGEAAILATGKAVLEWRARHRFCASCGAETEAAEGGWKRVCRVCRTEHFPRTDPVVIMLAVHGERCLLGRSARFTPGMYSALAGFMEPGETIEEACARELFEEAGLITASVRYHSSQPWPYPSSLMIGLIAEVTSDAAAPDMTELEAVIWLTREEARGVLAGENPEVLAPSPMAIARTLLQAWVDEG